MKRLLIVIDMLTDFCAIDGALAKSIVTGEYYGRDIIVPVLARVNDYRATNDPIIWPGDWHREDDEEFKRFPVHAVRNTPGAMVVDGLAPHIIDASPYELMIHKTRYSGFYGTDLEYQLGRLGPRKVEVCGVCTSICVMDTVGGLANRDYNTTVYRNAVADFDPAAHEMALARMERLYGAHII